jgi:hypothetical protein
MFTREVDEERNQDLALMRMRLAQKLKQYLGSESANARASAIRIRYSQF